MTQTKFIWGFKVDKNYKLTIDWHMHSPKSHKA